MENILYKDSFLDEDKCHALEYSGVEEDLLVVETDQYIVFLTVVDNTLVTDGTMKYKKYEEFPEELKEAIRKNGKQDTYGKYKVLENCAFSYCINKKLPNDEEEFICCSDSFDQLVSTDEEIEKMMTFLQSQI